MHPEWQIDKSGHHAPENQSITLQIKKPIDRNPKKLIDPDPKSVPPIDSEIVSDLKKEIPLLIGLLITLATLTYKLIAAYQQNNLPTNASIKQDYRNQIMLTGVEIYTAYPILLIGSFWLSIIVFRGIKTCRKIKNKNKNKSYFHKSINN
ncbi:MAG: hypothetical protein ACSHX6_10730 [Akkermansiaceae bacterium]